MTEKKLTESEIMKALEICGKGIMFSTHDCKKCPYYTALNCERKCKQNTLDLLNRKNAENERLEKEVDRLSQVVLYHDGKIADAQAEAIHEFAERVIKEGEKNVDYYTPEGCDLFFKNGTSCGYVVMKNTISKIAAEMGVEL